MNTSTRAAAYVVSVIGVGVVFHTGCVWLFVFLATLGLHSLVTQVFAAVTRRVPKPQGDEEGALPPLPPPCTTPDKAALPPDGALPPPCTTPDKGARLRREGRPPAVPDLLLPFQLEWLTVADLKVIAKMKGLPSSGLKCDLVQRLTKASQNHRQVLKGDPVDRLT